MAKKRGISKKLSLWIAGSLAILILVSAFFLNSFLEGVVNETLAKELNRLNKSERYHLAIEDIQLNIFAGNLSLIGLSAEPTNKSMELYEQGASEEKVLKELLVSRADIKGISLFNFLWDKNLDIRDILVEEITFNLYRPGNNFELKGLEEKKKSSFSLDSLRIPGITSVDLSKITVANYQLNIINKSQKDTLSAYKGEELVFSGLALKPADGDNPYFEIDDSKLELDLRNQVYNLSGGLYYIAFDNLNFSTESGKLTLKNFAFKPLSTRDVFASKHRYTYEIFNVEMVDFNLHGVNTSLLIASGAVSLDSITIDQMVLEIFKDKTKPFNTGKNKFLPNEQLKKVDQPFHLKKVNIANSELKYSELLPKNQKTLEVTLSDLNASVDYITSIRDSIREDRSLHVKLSANLLDAVPLVFNLDMPYVSPSNSFSFSGSTQETTSFRKLNSVVYPALGIRLKNGRLNGMEFNAQGNPHRINGDLVMYYKDLEIELDSKKDKENKSINWIANSFVKSSNPNKKGRLIIGSMQYERDYSKGMGNFIWKSVQSGIVNSFNPLGKREKKK